MAEKKKEIILSVDSSVLSELERQEARDNTLSKGLAYDLDDFSKTRQLQRKGFTYDPTKTYNFDGLYIRRNGLIPSHIYYQLADADSLVASILNVRGSQAARFGYPQVNRHDIGYKIAFKNNEVENALPHKDKLELQMRMRRVRDLFYTCGNNDQLALSERLSLPQFLKESVRYALLFGLSATEIIKDQLGNFKAFRPIDAGTIYKAVTKDHDTPQLANLRAQALTDLQNLSANHKINLDKFISSDDYFDHKYAWIQCINNIPRSAFKDSELLVRYFYAASDIENQGYPKPPLDTIVKEVSSHIHILTNNHNYFANGRATRGFLKLKGDNVSEHVVQRIRAQFVASVNSSANAFRMPLFGIPSDADISWNPMDQSSKDMEFQYLSDNTARAIMSGFTITPEEIPGYGHLSKPTTTQALSESNNEYSLQVGRSAGLIPLIMEMESMMNDILKQMDPMVAEYCCFKFVGLENDDPQKESTRLQQEANLHLTFNQMLKVVGKDPSPIGGNFPLNPAFMNLLKQQYAANIVNYAFTGDKSMLTDPTLFYVSDGNWFQFLQLFQNLLKSKGRVQKFLQDNLDEMKQLLYNNTVIEVDSDE